jgi:MFS family permease
VQYPTVFDAKGLFGTFPYLLPNLVTAVFNLAGLIGGFLFLAEPKVERNVAADGSSYPPVWRQRKAMLATLAYVFLGFVFVLYEEAMPLFLAATNGGMGMMTAQIGLFQSILGGVFLVTTFFYRYIPERIGLLKTHRLGLLMSVPLMVVTPLTAWVVKQPTAVVWTVMVVLCVAWGITGACVSFRFLFSLKSFADNLSFAPIMVLIANGTRKSQLGALNGVAQSGVALMRATGPVLAGTLFAWSIEPSRNFPYFVFLIMAALTLCLFGYALLLPPELDKPFVEPPEQRELHNMSA